MRGRVMGVSAHNSEERQLSRLKYKVTFSVHGQKGNSLQKQPCIFALFGLVGRY